MSIIIDDDAYEELLAAMTVPVSPTESIRKAARMMRELYPNTVQPQPEQVKLAPADAGALFIENRNLKIAILKYGHHTGHCRYHGGHDCDCGLDDLIEQIRKS